MKLAIYWKSAILISAIIFTGTAFAAAREDDEKKECKKPKFREFVPVAKTEVLPESVISFHVSRGADPHSVTAEAKTEKLKVTVTDRVNFLVASAKLPASLRDGFARIHLTARDQEGGCLGQDGWLIKIKPSGEPVIAPANAQKNK